MGRNGMKWMHSNEKRKSLSHDLRSERASEKMSIAECARESSSAEQSNE